MKYISTRGDSLKLNFKDVLLTGLANDGGLYVPQNLPCFTQKQISSFKSLSYQELAFEIISQFVGDSITKQKLKYIIDESYASFNHKAIAPLTQVDHNFFVLELYHGPTMAFKDFALQILGRLIDYFLKENNEKGVVIGATSGDTGSASIHACKNCSNLDIFIMHPNKMISDIQRKQMTTVLNDNVFNIALNGNFDDCQNLVKASFLNQDFLNGRRLIAVNSINFVRIISQIVYYFASALRLGAPYQEVSFSVPTGNFGDIYAGFLAKKMGLPINQLIVATNKNDILHNFFSKNQYFKKEIVESLSPSMDIAISSNFERLLFEYYGKQGCDIKSLMQNFHKTGELNVSNDIFYEMKKLFHSVSVSDEDTLFQIKETYNNCSYFLDPHSAIGLFAGYQVNINKDIPMISLATAHLAKFSDVIKQLDIKVDFNNILNHILNKEEKFVVMDNDIEQLHKFINLSL